MTTIARKTWNMNLYDNTTLDNDNLAKIAVDIIDDYKKCTRTYLFEDNSALVNSDGNNWDIITKIRSK